MRSLHTQVFLNIICIDTIRTTGTSKGEMVLLHGLQKNSFRFAKAHIWRRREASRTSSEHFHAKEWTKRFRGYSRF